MTHAYDSPFYFTWAGERYAVKGGDLRGVMAQPDPAVLPGGVPGVMGLIAWRGAVIPLMTANEPSGMVTARVHVAVVVETDGGDLALAADEVLGWEAPDGSVQSLDVDRIYHSARETVRQAHPDAEGESR